MAEDLNRRVCEVVLNGDKTFSLRQQKYKVSDTLKTGEASVLFGPLSIYPIESSLIHHQTTSLIPSMPF